MFGRHQNTFYPISEVKDLVANDDEFGDLVQSAIKLRQTDLPKVDEDIANTKKSIRDLAEKENQLSQKLVSSDLTDDLVKWFSAQVSKLKRDQELESQKLDLLQKRRLEVLDESGLRDIKGQVKKAVQGFDELTRVQQRLLLGKIISEIVVRSDNKIEIKLVGSEDSVPLKGSRSKTDFASSVTGRNDLLESEENWRSIGAALRNGCSSTGSRSFVFSTSFGEIDFDALVTPLTFSQLASISLARSNPLGDFTGKNGRAIL